ncbi:MULTISPECIES: 2Fe-2S iron-sulfur cluster-binding protein [Methylomonas]|uniref:Oxygenase n=1 Tax=Methylomonas koyamae TaxID=702114 RepID=A0A177NJJ2_9GAMM|nr:2Fe-2S iron-sulfur cluster-binding protein [Methylomonas koyamae]OAI17369.1 oxygenase [Methylomonas koyamae]
MAEIKISFNGRQALCGAGETVLDAFLRDGIEIDNGCRQGVCHACLVRSLDGPPPAAAQVGLKPALQREDYLLACLCRPERDMRLGLGGAAAGYTAAEVVEKRNLNAQTLWLALECEHPLAYYAGQFVNLRRADGLIRSYSIANSRNSTRLTFHIRRLAGGRFSEWAHRELAVGDRIDVSDPQGFCYYLADLPAANLLLIGTGSGLAPLAGIVEEALHNGHRGQIRLYHGSRDVEGLYWLDEMRDLARAHANFHYTPCVSRGDAPSGIAAGRANDVAMAELPGLRDWRVYLCGHPDMVDRAKRQAYLSGAALADIHSDAFHVASPTLD